MRRRSISGILVLVALLMAACDSAEERTASELLVGKWTLAKAEDQEGDKTPAVQQAGRLEITFVEAGTFELFYDPSDGSEDERLSNTYTVNEGTGKLVLTATNPFDGSALPVEVGFSFRNDDELVLTIPASTVVLVGALVPPFAALKGEVRLTLRRT